MARLVIERLLAPGEAVVVAVDDTLFRRYGRTVHAAAWQHDGSAPGPRKIGFGNNWVIVGIVVALPMLTRPVCLPVLFRLWRPKSGTSKVDHAVAMVTRLTGAHPDRKIHAVGDAAYHGPACKTLPPTVSWTCRLPANATRYALAPPRTGKRGAPRKKGDLLGKAADVAATATFTELSVTRYGKTETISVAHVDCLWYGAFGPQPVRLSLVREQGTTSGYDLALISTDGHSAPETIVTRYASRWSIEVVNLEGKHVLGVGQARNRTETTVNRTVPSGLLVMSLVVLWYAAHGHHPDDVAARREESPWYATKTEPSSEDMLVKLRRVIIAARFMPTRRFQPTAQEILAVQQAWAAA